MNLSALLTVHRNEIVSRFVSEVQREQLAPSSVERPVLVDHVPILLDEIVDELELQSRVAAGQDVTDTSPTARKHGEQRRQVGYELEAVVREYGVLRHVIVEMAKQFAAAISLDQFDLLNKCLNVGVAEAVTAYVRYRNEQAGTQSSKEAERVAAASRAKDEFVGVVSHELRTPLNAIIGWVRLLRGGSLSQEKREHALHVIERNANAQSLLVADLLDISRITMGRIRIRPAQVDLSNIIDVAIEDARLAFEAKRIEVHSDLERQNAVMRGDADRLQQIVWNLLTNALKFTPKGGIVRIQLRRIESDLELSVSDNGRGIRAEFLDSVFESFRQWDSSATRAHGGLGIGLSITKHLVNLHGGSIEVSSEGVGKGATFVVRLPVSPLVSPTLGVVKVAETAPVPAAPLLPEWLEGLKVLLVEDDDDARDLVTTVLETRGMLVHPTGSAREALHALNAQLPNVMISDVGMPDMDGYELIRTIRGLPGEKALVKAIALTAFVRNEDRERALAEGFDAHLTKPVEPAELLAAIADLLGKDRPVEG